MYINVSQRNCSMVGSLGEQPVRTATWCLPPVTYSPCCATDPSIRTQLQHLLSTRLNLYPRDPATRCLVITRVPGGIWVNYCKSPSKVHLLCVGFPFRKGETHPNTDCGPTRPRNSSTSALGLCLKSIYTLPQCLRFTECVVELLMYRQTCTTASS
jgi:hypothetical protein